MSLLVVLAVVAVLLALNALFVAAEFALIAAPRTSVERKATEGDRTAARVLDVMSSPADQDRYIATAQLGITLASLGLGMYGEHALANMLEHWLGGLSIASEAAIGAGLSLAILTVAHITVGEMLPKGLALQNPERVVRAAYWPMRATLLALYPFVTLSNAVARLTLRLMGVRRSQNVREQVYTPEELQLIVEESERGGALRGESGRIVRELLEFGDLTASQVMVPRVRVVGVPVGATPAVMRQIVLQHRRTRYAVYEGDLDHVVGMVHAKDLLRRLIEDEPLAASHARRVPVVPETASLDAVLDALQRAHAHMAVVIDEHGGTAGIVSLEDLFEEVVGEIDEGVPVSAPVTPLADGSARVAGTARLDEVGQHFDLRLEHEEVESVSGVVLAVLGRPPVVGDVVEYGGLR
ncbi:MAG TPA: hemolysin family protein, partial [Kofleriaceae bacterium]|nr:hemolysin family protein [Kofleriaceae bacterium]